MTLLGILFILLPIIAMWVIFSKAGRPGWAAIIPIYNVYTLVKVAGKPGWWIILFCIPVVNLIFYVLTLDGISKSFNKSTGFTIGLFLLPFIFYLLLAFGDATYTAPAVSE